MDLVGYSTRRSFDAIVADFDAFAAQLGFDDSRRRSRCRRSTATTSSTRSAAMPWYDGPTLLGYLETVEVGREPAAPAVPLAGAVGQPAESDFRGFAGTVVERRGPAGRRASRSLPSATTSTRRADRHRRRRSDEAVAGQAVTLTLADEIDVRAATSSLARRGAAGSRRSVRRAPGLDGRRAAAARPLLLHEDRHADVPATVSPTQAQGSTSTRSSTSRRKTLQLNEIGFCNLQLDRRSPSTPTPTTATLGGFILIDRLTNATVGAGMIRFALRRAQQHPLAGARRRQGARAG